MTTGSGPDNGTETFLAGLNEAQREAVTLTEGYVRVIAGAGSGKTRALARRFAYLVDTIGILPENILCVTFTNKSANEMKQRIRRLTGDNDTGYIATFHSFCVTVLQEDIHAAQYPQSFFVLDNADIDAMLKIIYDERGLTLRHKTFARARDMIEIRKIFKEPEYYEEMLKFSLAALQEKYLSATETDDIIFYGYLYQEKKCFGLDYNDLLKYVLYIFESNAEIRLKWQQRLEYIMIDEFQDIDELQYRLMKVLCAYHGNLFVVGDPDQTIYTWRGANVKYIMDFDREFPGTRTVMMMENYRSTPQIVAAANSLIRNNKQRVEKDLLAKRPDGAPVVYHHARTSLAEAKWITEQIKQLLEQGVKPGDVAVLYRAHYVTRQLEEVFLQEGLSYRIYSGVQFFGRKEIKDALSYLRLIVYGDDLSFQRVANVPKRNLGERRMAFLKEYAAQNNCTLLRALELNSDHEIFLRTKAKQLLALVQQFTVLEQEAPVSELLGALLDKSGYETLLRTEGSQERLDNLAELKQALYEYELNSGEECSAADYLARVALLTNTDTFGGERAVKLMTVHAAKGLEFPQVFLCALSEGIFPSRKASGAAAMEEERRLAFVAFTRAQDTLRLSDAEGRNLDGSYRYPSRFIFNVDRPLLVYTEVLEESLVAETFDKIADSEQAIAAQAAGPQFAAGAWVRHVILGVGNIVAVDVDKGVYEILFAALGTTRKINFRVRLTAAE